MSSLKMPMNYWRLWTAHTVSNLGNGVSAIAFPWLASALTRSPLTIAIVGLMSQLPWLLFTLPAGVVTDRFDRKKIIIATDVARGLVTLIACAILFANRSSFLHIKDPTNGYTGSSGPFLIGMMIVATFILGSAEVLGNNSSQTFLPDVVEETYLQKANGQMASAESIANQFAGPALGSLLLGISIYIPFLFDAGSFFASAALIALITSQGAKIVNNRKGSSESASQLFTNELKEGFRWLMSHRILRPMAFTLGSLNFISSMALASYILFAQEVLHVSIFVMAILGTAGAFGGLVGGIAGPKLIGRIGEGTTLTIALISFPTLFLLGSTVTRWYIFYILVFLEMFTAVFWNIVTVSFRQTIIPSELLGRVNSGYRFFGWGSMPLGSLSGGLITTVSAHYISREYALRLPFVVAGVIGLGVFLATRGRFTSERLESAKSSA
jgi:MFS family permease